MRTASSTASCAAGVWANAAVVTSKRVNRVRIAVLDARGTDLVAGPRGGAPLNLSCKHSIRSSKVAGTFRAYRRTNLPLPDYGRVARDTGGTSGYQEWAHLWFAGFSGRRNAALSNAVAMLSVLRTYKGFIAFSTLRPN